MELNNGTRAPELGHENCFFGQNAPLIQLGRVQLFNLGASHYLISQPFAEQAQSSETPIFVAHSAP